MTPHQRLREQEQWGRWNTGPLANRLYGKPHKAWDFVAYAAGWAVFALTAWSILQ